MAPRIGIRRNLDRKIQSYLLLGKYHDVGIDRLYPSLQGVDCVFCFARDVPFLVLGPDILRLHVHRKFRIRAVPEMHSGGKPLAPASRHIEARWLRRHRQGSGKAGQRNKGKKPRTNGNGQKPKFDSAKVTSIHTAQYVM